MMAQTEYKGRHDKLAKVINWDLCKTNGVQVTAKWYEHVPDKVVETDQVIKIVWDFNIQTDHVIQQLLMLPNKCSSSKVFKRKLLVIRVHI